MSEQKGERLVPPRGHPTLQMCPECPAYLDHDGAGGLVCSDKANHVADTTGRGAGQ